MKAPISLLCALSFACSALGQTTSSYQWRPLDDVWADGLTTFASIAYNPATDQHVMFGGRSNNTYVFDGVTWNRRHPKTSPPDLGGASLGYDPVSKELILFGGGQPGRATVNDTWAWDGRDWRRLAPSAAPSPRGAAAMAHDPIRKRLVLFGGGPTAWQRPNDTWEWTGSTWQLVNTPQSPEGRISPAMAFNNLTGRITLYGGTPLKAPFHTWEYDGSNWTKITATPNPGDCNAFALAPVSPWSSGGGVYGFGGVPNPLHVDDFLWHWDGQNWTKLGKPLSRLSGLHYGLLEDPQQRRWINPLQSYWSSYKVITRAWDGTQWKLVDEWARADSQIYVFDETRAAALAFGVELVDRKENEVYEIEASGRPRRLSMKLPPSRNWPLLVNYPPAKGVLMFGGAVLSNGTILDDTWLFDGTKWTKQPTTIRPAGGPMHLNQAGYDRKTETVYLLRDRTLWSWNKRGWRKVTPASGRLISIAYDEARDIFVCLADDRSNKLEVWTWDRRTWRQHQPKQVPPYRESPALAYAPGLGGVALVGGRSPNSALSDVWVWDGSDFRQVVASKPIWYSAPSQAYWDTRRQRLIAARTNDPWDRLWELVPDPTLSTSELHPRPGEGFTLSIKLPQQATTPLLLLLSGTDHPGIPLIPVSGGFQELPLAADPLFFAMLSQPLIRLLDATGQTNFAMQVPTLPSLIGTSFYVAGVTIRGSKFGAVTNNVRMFIAP